MFALAMRSEEFVFYTALIAASAAIVTSMLDLFWYNVSKFGKQVALPLGVFFLIFLAQFNVVRGWAYAIQRDDYLIVRVGGLDPMDLMTKALAWIALFILSFTLCYKYVKIPQRLLYWGDRAIIFKAVDPATILRNKTQVLVASIGVTILCALFIIGLSVIAGGADLSSVIGSAYVYMIPMSIYAMCLAFYGAILATARDGKFFWVLLLLMLYAVIAYFGRTLSQFRIYAITLPALIAGYHIAQKRRFVLTIVGIALAFPVVNYLGRNRMVSNKDLQANVAESLNADLERGISGFFLAPYSAAGGDFTTVDMFASALKEEPSHHPYGLSWLYIIVHVIPRQLWEGKPEGGILVDTSFSNVLEGGRVISLPYTPGVVGDAYLEGGWPFIFVIGAMFGFGYKWLDTLLMRRLAMFGPTMDYCVTYAAFLFVAFFANRSLPYFIALYCALNIVGVFAGRYVIQWAIKMIGQQSASGPIQRTRPTGQLKSQARPLFPTGGKSSSGQA